MARCKFCRADEGWFQRGFVLRMHPKPLFFHVCVTCIRRREQRRGGPRSGGRPAPFGASR